MPDKETTVVEAIASIMGALGGIAKMTPEERRKKGLGGGDTGISYAYRGIDQIAAAVQPLLAEHGVILVPFVTDSTVKEITVNSKPWTDTFVTVKWSIYGPNNSMVEACTEGWGRDNADKGYNKAMTGAFKNLLLRLLCIGDPDDDTDGHTHERDINDDRPRAARAEQTSDGPREITMAQQVAAKFSSLDPEGKKIVNAFAKEMLGITNVMRSGEKAEQLMEYINALAAPTTEPEEESF